jgi:protein-S-isoprenylcysteine O-methyltransferase Ste14
MKRVVFFLYGTVAYLAFLATILYGIGFVTGLVVPKTINDGVQEPAARAMLINVGLLLLFAIQHTIMARPGFKQHWTKIVPKPIERSTFVLAASLILMLLFWQWRPLPETVWHVEQPALRGLLLGLSLLGWAMVFYSSFVIDHFDLFGLRQVTLYLLDRPYTHPVFMERSFYRYIRHPLMAGFLIAFWATPTMTQGHLLFAVVTTVYIFFGITVEERDLLRILGEPYARYRERTPMILPFPRQKTSAVSDLDRKPAR